VRWFDSLAQHAHVLSPADLFSVIAVVLLAGLGIGVSVIPPQKGKRWPLVCVFIALGAIGILASLWQVSDAKIEAARSGEESKRNALGDPDHPPFLAVISLPKLTRFVVTNGSDYPAYGTKIRAYDDTPGSARHPVDWSYPEMGPHVAFMDDKPWIASDRLSKHHFMISIATRTGLVTEELFVRKAENNQWMQAFRVTRGIQTLQENVDSAWPRKPDGSIDWTK
jgi:hypothetical protein